MAEKAFTNTPSQDDSGERGASLTDLRRSSTFFEEVIEFGDDYVANDVSKWINCAGVVFMHFVFPKSEGDGTGHTFSIQGYVTSTDVDPVEATVPDRDNILDNPIDVGKGAVLTTLGAGGGTTHDQSVLPWIRLKCEANVANKSVSPKVFIRRMSR